MTSNEMSDLVHGICICICIILKSCCKMFLSYSSTITTIKPWRNFQDATTVSKRIVKRSPEHMRVKGIDQILPYSILTMAWDVQVRPRRKNLYSGVVDAHLPSILIFLQFYVLLISFGANNSKCTSAKT